MKVEAAEKWVDKKQDCRTARLTVDRWHSRDLDRERWNLAYWFIHNGKTHRINQIGDSLPEAVELCQLAEEIIKSG